MIPPVVDAAFLAEHPDTVLADVRWYLDGRDGRAAFEAGHIAGARWVDLEHALSRHGADATDGRHPLPDPEQFAAAMTALGVGDDTTVVAYDDTGGMTAGRLAVMLRMLGHDAAVLDGGLRAWRGSTEVGPQLNHLPATPPFTPRPWPRHRLAAADDAATAAFRGAVLLDARSHDRFTGEVTAVDPRPGHIPGAANAPWTAVLDEDGRFRSADQLHAHFADLGAADGHEAIAYCGSGVSACMNVLAMERAGLDPPRLYVASWSGWSADPDREAATGE